MSYRSHYGSVKVVAETLNDVDPTADRPAVSITTTNSSGTLSHDITITSHSSGTVTLTLPCSVKIGTKRTIIRGDTGGDVTVSVICGDMVFRPTVPDLVSMFDVLNTITVVYIRNGTWAITNQCCPDATPPAALIHYYDMELGVIDIISGNNFVPSTVLTHTPSYNGTVERSYVATGATAQSVLNDYSGAWVIDFWLYPYPASTGGNYKPWLINEHLSTPSGFTISNAGSYPIAPIVNFYGAGPVQSFTSPVQFTARGSRWHVALYYNGSGTFQFYMSEGGVHNEARKVLQGSAVYTPTPPGGLFRMGNTASRHVSAYYDDLQVRILAPDEDPVQHMLFPGLRLGPTLSLLMENGSGTTLSDSSGNLTDATIDEPSAVTWIADGVAGSGALSFDSSVAVKVSGPDVFLPAGSHNGGQQELSISCWFRIAADPANQIETLFVYGNTGSGAANILCLTNAAPGVGVALAHTTDFSNKLSVAVSISHNVWHNLIGVANGGVEMLYFDGVLVATRVASTVTQLTGTYFVGTLPDGSSPFTGDIDEVKVYSKNTTLQEAQRLYAKISTTPFNFKPSHVLSSGINQNGNNPVRLSATGDTITFPHDGFTGFRVYDFDYDALDWVQRGQFASRSNIHALHPNGDVVAYVTDSPYDVFAQRWDGVSWSQHLVQANIVTNLDSWFASPLIALDGDRVLIVVGETGTFYVSAAVYEWNGSGYVSMGPKLTAAIPDQEKAGDISGDVVAFHAKAPGNVPGVAVFRYTGATWVSETVLSTAGTVRNSVALRVVDNGRIILSLDAAQDGQPIRILRWDDPDSNGNWTLSTTTLRIIPGNTYTGAQTARNLSASADGTRLVVSMRVTEGAVVNLARVYVLRWNPLIQEYYEFPMEIPRYGDFDYWGNSSYISADGERIVVAGYGIGKYDYLTYRVIV